MRRITLLMAMPCLSMLLIAGCGLVGNDNEDERKISVAASAAPASSIVRTPRASTQAPVVQPPAAQSDAGDTTTASSDVTAADVSTNALDSLRFGLTTDEAAHGMNGAPGTAGVGAFGHSYRVIAPSPSAPGDASQNLALRFRMACDTAKQNYITVKLWGSDTTPGFLYLYEPARGHEPRNYYEQSRPELDYQGGDPISPGRFVYVTYPIPLSMTQGRTSVALELNAARHAGAQLAAGETSRPVYAAWTHAGRMLNLVGSDVQSSVPAPIAPTPVVFDDALAADVRRRFAERIPSMSLFQQLYGSGWTDAVAAGRVPREILGLLIVGANPNDARSLQEWRDHAARATAAGNNRAMHRLTLVAAAFERNVAPEYYHSVDLRDRMIAALDGYWRMQSLNGAFGGPYSNVPGWFGIGSTAATADNPQGRLNTEGSALEGEGTQALGRMFIAAASDAGFISALDGDIDSVAAPGMKRWQAYAQMFSRHAGFLYGMRGTAPNQDGLQARALLLAHHAEKLLVARYPALGATTLSDQQMLTYVQQATGVLPGPRGAYWFTSKGLCAEVHGVGNGGYDGGGYGTNCMRVLIEIARFLKELGYENDASHPVRDVAVQAIRAFSNFYMPSVTADGYATMRRENNITFRKSSNFGGIDTGASYTAAVQFGDPYALHGVFIERNLGYRFLNGSEVRWSEYATEALDYLTLIDRIGSGELTDSVSFLHEDAHPDGAWVDIEAGAISFKQNGNHGFIALNYRPFGYGEGGPFRNPDNPDPTVSHTARMHLIGPNIERILTLVMPSDAANGATDGFTSGNYGGLYLVRFGPYVHALNLQSSPASFTPPTLGWAQDWVSGEISNRTTWTLIAKSGALLTQGATQVEARTTNIETTGSIPIVANGSQPLTPP